MAEILSTIKHLVNCISNGLARISGLTILLVTLIMTADVIMRYLFNRPLLFATETCEFLLCLLVFTGLGYTFKEGGHISIDFVYRKLPSKIKYCVRTVTLGIASLYIVVLTWQLFLFIKETYNFNRKSTVLHFPLWIPQLAMVLGALILTLMVLVAFAAHRNREHDRREDN